MSYDGVTWNEAVPDDNNQAADIDDFHRDGMKAVRSRMAHEHIWPSSQTGTDQAGFHRYITLSTQFSTPGLVYGADTQAAAIYALSSGTGVSVFVRNSGGNPVMLQHSTYTGGGVVPKGGIILWSGAVSAVPEGWAICDGTNGTPDLSNAFVIHADADAGGTHDVGDTGSKVAAHTHTVPDHQHTLRHNTTAGGRSSLETADGTDTESTAFSISSGTCEVSSTGDIVYYALAYIMKL